MERKEIAFSHLQAKYDWICDPFKVLHKDLAVHILQYLDVKQIQRIRTVYPLFSGANS